MDFLNSDLQVYTWFTRTVVYTKKNVLPKNFVFRWLTAGSNNMSRESFQGKRVLVTGGGGYFGHKLGNALKKKGAEVIAFDISWPLNCKTCNGWYFSSFHS